jgi:hypothetical protein
MAGVTLDQLPPALALNGGELVWLYQQGPTIATPWIGVQCTASQLAAFANALYKLPSAGFVSMRQLVAALNAQGNLVTVFEALPSDITNQYNIGWNHAYIITQADPLVTGFIQPTLGYSGAQIATLFALAATFPV